MAPPVVSCPDDTTVFLTDGSYALPSSLMGVRLVSLRVRAQLCASVCDSGDLVPAT